MATKSALDAAPCLEQFSLKIGPGIKVSSVKLPSSTAGSILSVTGNDEIEIQPYNLDGKAEITSKGAGAPNEWLVRVASGIDVTSVTESEVKLEVRKRGDHIIAVPLAPPNEIALVLTQAPPTQLRTRLAKGRVAVAVARRKAKKAAKKSAKKRK